MATTVDIFNDTNKIIVIDSLRISIRPSSSLRISDFMTMSNIMADDEINVLLARGDVHLVIDGTTLDNTADMADYMTDNEKMLAQLSPPVGGGGSAESPLTLTANSVDETPLTINGIINQNVPLTTYNIINSGTPSCITQYGGWNVGPWDLFQDQWGGNAYLGNSIMVDHSAALGPERYNDISVIMDSNDTRWSNAGYRDRRIGGSNSNMYFDDYIAVWIDEPYCYTQWTHNVRHDEILLSASVSGGSKGARLSLWDNRTGDGNMLSVTHRLPTNPFTTITCFNVATNGITSFLAPNGGAGKVWTSDASGYGAWQNAAAAPLTPPIVLTGDTGNAFPPLTVNATNNESEALSVNVTPKYASLATSVITNSSFIGGDTTGWTLNAYGVGWSVVEGGGAVQHAAIGHDGAGTIQTDVILGPGQMWKISLVVGTFSNSSNGAIGVSAAGNGADKSISAAGTYVFYIQAEENFGGPLIISANGDVACTITDIYANAVIKSKPALSVNGMFEMRAKNGFALYLGMNSGQNDTNGGATSNVAVGYDSQASVTEAAGNTSIGCHTLNRNKTGIGNTAVGHYSLYNTIGDTYYGANNVAVGSLSMYLNTFGFSNVAVGVESLTDNQTGSENVAIGAGALHNSDFCIQNVAVGSGALNEITAINSDHNVALGSYAGSLLLSGANNIFIGNNAHVGEGGGYVLNNSVAIGANVTVATNNTIVIGNDSHTNAWFGTTSPTVVVHAQGFTTHGSTGNVPTITSGNGVPQSTPAKVGDIYVDWSNKKLYFSAGNSNSGDWIAAN